jgi:hypothetical protein
MENPFQSGADKKKQSDTTIDTNVRKSQSDTRRATTARNNQVLQNVSKTLAPIIALQLTNTIIQIVSQNGKLQDLVNKTNIVIDSANTQNQINQAITLRNAAIQIINNQEKKVLSLQNTINTISTFIQVFNTIVSILSSLPIPTAVPPGIGIPLTVITKITNIIAKAQYLIAALGVTLAVMVPILGQAIVTLEDLKTQLHNINGLLDNITSNNNNIDNNINLLLGTNFSFGTNFPIYKGFKFAVKEENNLAFVVRGNKRHYAIAINSDGNEVLKSDYSFTLDPNDLIEQLKLTIDQKNLQA